MRPLDNGGAQVELGLASDLLPPALSRWWPSPFELTYLVTVGPSLDLALTAKNTGDAPFTFDEALHTYLSVGDVRAIQIDGLAGKEYLDKTDGQRRKTQPSAPIVIEGETDRLYVNTTDTVTVSAAGPGGAPGTVVVAKEGSASTVVWNPWVAKSKAFTDFGDDEWPGMVCIETVNAADNSITLAPGAAHTMKASIRSGGERGAI